MNSLSSHVRKKNKYLITVSLVTLLWSVNISGQERNETEKLHRNRIGIAMGHSHIPSALEADGKEKLMVVPSWCLSYAFSLTDRFSIGLKTDFETTSYIIEDEEGSELERENPMSLMVSFEYKVYKELGFFAAPGIEFEQDENLFIAVFGVFYEFGINERWDFTPELVYELKGGHTSVMTVEFGIGYKF